MIEFVKVKAVIYHFIYGQKHLREKTVGIYSIITCNFTEIFYSVGKENNNKGEGLRGKKMVIIKYGQEDSK